MPWCPECGAWLWFGPTFGEETVCKKCGAILTREFNLSGIFGHTIKVVGNVRDRERILSTYLDEDSTTADESSEESGQSDYSNYHQNIPEVNQRSDTEHGERDEPMVISSRRFDTEARCRHCNTAVTTPGAKFCPNCGAILHGKVKSMAITAKGTRTQAKTTKVMNIRTKTTKSRKAHRIQDCIVCGVELSQDDDVVWCPQCGKLAHRNHLIEWVRTKHRCPSCGKNLDEEYYK